MQPRNLSAGFLASGLLGLLALGNVETAPSRGSHAAPGGPTRVTSDPRKRAKRQTASASRARNRRKG
jgi:hypothetical protein